MTVLWLLFWLFSGAPEFGFPEDSWAIGLMVCAGIDLAGLFKFRVRIR